MDEGIGDLLQRACELARNLESSYHNQPDDVVLRRIDEILKKLDGARERLMLMASSRVEALKPQTQGYGLSRSSGSTSSYVPVQSVSQLIQMQQQRQLQAPRSTTPSGRGTLQIGEIGGGREGSSERSKGSEGDVEASPSRRRKRKDPDAEKKTVMIPAPQYGNTEMPPEDGYTWRKYGQKEILGSNYPRSYYRCTHQKLYECLAKKQVQRLDNNPNIFAVTYRGEHTCHMSSTAPSSSVPPLPLPLDISRSQDITHATTSSHLSPSATSVSRWLSPAPLGFLTGSGGGGGVAPAGADAGGGGAAGPSTTRFGGADYPVADMADAMFNSGSSSGNSMECLFPPSQGKWETGDKKS